ncbi:MAG TPA: pyruvate carboxylase [Tepidisphaeraceae bacterium]|jgi:pyruvate carboxylase|nr:pyruvate carboxylase [Tepidisphaeraceae bacterium]
MRKLLVANRSEIAIRVFRAATELGLGTVAVYTYEDRFSLHRFKADEAYLVGPHEGGAPVKGYLDIPALIAIAKEHGVDAIHPGYGFLAENAELSRACQEAGIIFVGPTPELLAEFGDKTAAKRLAKTANVPTLPGTEHGLIDPAEIRKAAKEIGYPVIIKASFGGGGRGMRVVKTADELMPLLEEAQREAGAAFGRGEVFVERYIARAKHIEVQILGDQHGNLVHLWERDCSVQRRHQKVVEIAPSIDLPLDLRRRICESAVRLCKTANYRNAGTVEFLLDVDRGDFFFIEVNPRIQVEHTVTEVVTGIDIVKSQILVAQGHKLHEAPLNIQPQEKIATNGWAIQCRITTEDPENNFIPDYGRLTTYRSPGGFAVRLDGGNGFGGAVITPYFDSLLVKVTTWGTTFQESIRRMDRALREFRVRGVKTNIPFLENLLRHPQFVSGDATTTFIDSTPELFRFRARRDRATKILAYLGDVIINGRPEVKGKVNPKKELPEPVIPAYTKGAAPPPGLRHKLLELGPEKFAEHVRKQKKLLLTDTTMRDAHQSLLATRVRTYDLLQIADAVAHLTPDLFSLEMWGGATFDTAMRFLQEDPWDRLGQLRTRVPNIPFQMLLRASNAVGYTNYPDNAVVAFTKSAAQHGIDVFRIFDSLNWAENMKVAIEAVREHTSAVCEAAICYTGDILDPKRTKYSLDYYVKLAKELVKMGTHVLGIKDMAGLCKPYAAHALVKALRDEVGVPIHFHTHDTSGINSGSLLRAADAGVDVIDGALASMSGMTSQPNLNSMVAALQHTPRDTGLDLDILNRLSDYWEAVREHYYPFEEGMKAPTAEVYHHEMPGGQYTNLRQQAKSMGLEHRWHEIADAYAEVNKLFGDIVKVTPSSKVVGDMALFMVTNGLTPMDVLTAEKKLNFPRSVVEMMQGQLGQPEGGWPKVLQKIILDSAGAKPIKGRPGEKLPPVDFVETKKKLEKETGREVRDTDVVSYVMYPQVFVDYDKHLRLYDNTSVIPTPAFFYGMQSGEEIGVEIEAGKVLIIRYLTTGEPHEDGTRTVFFELNGQPREVNVADRKLEGNLHKQPKADPDNPAHIAAPMPGKVSNVNVKKGQSVKEGERLLSIEAMKMETAVYSPRAAKVADVLVNAGSVVSARDLLIVLEG